MHVFIEYLIKLSVCYAVIWLFYVLLLRPLTHYKSNRVFLLSAALFAFAIPLINSGVFVPNETLQGSAIASYIPSFDKITGSIIFIPDDNNSSISVMYIMLFSGAMVCLFHFITQLLSFKRITSKAQFIQNINDIAIYQLDMDIMPFSFGKRIYVNRNNHSEKELQEIIGHESVHVKQKHTLDVLIIELVCMLNWYNPFIWLIKLAVKQNLEFLADEGVIQNGADKRSYQYLLLKVTGNSPSSIASNLNFSSLKKRIHMMNKTRTSDKHLLKLLLMLPVIALIIVAFRTDDAKPKGNTTVLTREDTFQLSELSYSIADTKVNEIVKQSQSESLLQVGQPFTINTIKNERDRLKALLERNGYKNINSHTISFLIDSSLTNNSFAVQVNINLDQKISATNNGGKNKNSNSVSADKPVNDNATSLNTNTIQHIQSVATNNYVLQNEATAKHVAAI